MKHISTILLPLLLLSSTPALAQPEPTKSTSHPFVLFDIVSPETEQKATEAHQAGKAAQKAGKLEQARELLAQAFALSPNWQRAADLGIAELALRRFPEAAKHFEFFLTHADKSNVRPEIWQMIVDYFRQATDNSLTLDISVNEPFAEVFMDGYSIGISPIKTPIFAIPGKHLFHARKDGFTVARTEIDSKAGEHSKVNLVLTASTTADAPHNTDFSAGPSAKDIPTWWHPTFLGLGGLSLGTALGFTFAAYDLGTIVATDERGLRTIKSNLDGADPCTLPSYRGQCNRLANRHSRQDTYTVVAITSYVFTGVFAFTAMAPHILPKHWFSWNNTSSPSSVHIYPVISPNHVGIIQQTPF